MTSNDDNDVEELEMLLEASFMQLDGTRNKILSDDSTLTRMLIIFTPNHIHHLNQVFSVVLQRLPVLLHTMMGITLLVDLWRKKQSFNMAHSYPSSCLFSASATAATMSVGASLASNDFFGFRTPVAYSDYGVLAVTDDYLSGVRTLPGKYFYHDTLKYSPNGYHFELKPLWSAFELRSFALISLRSFLMFCLPLLEPHENMEQDYDNFMQDKHDELCSKLDVPFKKSLLQIVREVTVVTTRCILERLTFHYASRKVAWRLLKDVPASAVRKAERGMSTYMYMLSVSKATLRGHTIGVAASWIVQVEPLRLEIKLLLISLLITIGMSLSNCS